VTVDGEGQVWRGGRKGPASAEDPWPPVVEAPMLSGIARGDRLHATWGAWLELKASVYFETEKGETTARKEKAGFNR
jgi:hypothetical protein